MKRFAVLVALLIALVFNFSSCKKCYTCDFGNRAPQKYCPKDFPDGYDGLKLTVDAWKKQGYTCTSN